MTLTATIHAHLVNVGRDTAVNLARLVGITVRQLNVALDADQRFQRVAGNGVWDWHLDPIGLAFSRGPIPLPPKPPTNFQFNPYPKPKPKPKQPKPKAPPKPRAPWVKPPELVRGHRGHGWQGIDGSPTIVVACRVLGPCTPREVADWAGITPAAVYHQLKIYGDRVVREAGRIRLRESA